MFPHLINHQFQFNYLIVTHQIHSFFIPTALPEALSVSQGRSMEMEDAHQDNLTPNGSIFISRSEVETFF